MDMKIIFWFSVVVANLFFIANLFAPEEGVRFIGYMYAGLAVVIYLVSRSMLKR
jgi:hypothetical protein